MTSGRLFDDPEPAWTIVDERLFLGTSGWSYDDWDGAFYPAGTSSRDRLSFYASRFRTVEIDSTFYACPARRTVQSWHERTPEGFIFSAKFPRTVTHQARLVGCGDEAQTFVGVMDELGDKLGPLLLQLPPSMTVDALDDLARFLEGLPDGRIYAVEARHPSWLVDDYAALLKRWQVALVLTDGAHTGRFWRVTSRIAYIRWLGGYDTFETYDHSRIDRDDDWDWWAPRMAHFIDRGGVVFGYANNNFTGFSPDAVRQIEQRIAGEL